MENENYLAEEYIAYEVDGQVIQMTATPKLSPQSDEYEHLWNDGRRDRPDASHPNHNPHRAVQVVGAFRNFGTADVQKVNLRFGVKLGGKAGVPHITEGSVESNLESSVKCIFLPKVPPTNQL